MLIRDVMSRDLEVVTPNDSIKDAAKKMDDLDVGVLPVCDNGRLVGIVTDRDIVVRSVSVGQDSNTTQVQEAMTAETLVYCFDDQDIEVAAKLMKDNKIRRIPILDRNQSLVGMLSLGDIAVQQEQLGAEVTKKVSESPKTTKAA